MGRAQQCKLALPQSQAEKGARQRLQGGSPGSVNRPWGGHVHDHSPHGGLSPSENSPAEKGEYVSTLGVTSVLSDAE